MISRTPAGETTPSNCQLGRPTVEPSHSCAANYEDPWTVHILDLAKSQTSLLRIPWSVGDSRPAWSPDGTRFLLHVSVSIASANVDGSGFQRHVQAAPYVGDPDWSPDGKTIVFEKFTTPGNQSSPVGSRMRIFASSLDDGSVRQLIPEADAPALPDYWDSQPGWSRVRQ
jgi:Tol biopolymer transport system component